MSSVNKVILVGNLGADPEVKQFNNGGSVTNITLATSERFTNKQGEKVENTEWHRIAFFGKTGEIAAQWLRKGSKIYMEGSIHTRKYEKDGQDHYVTEIKGYNLTMLGEAGGGQAQNGEQRQQNNPQQRQNNNQAQVPRKSPTPPQAAASNQPDDDDIPF